MQKSRRAPLWRVLASVLTGALIASGAALGVAVPAQAADGPAVSAPEAPRAGGNITISGTGFSTVEPGIYLSIRQNGTATDSYTAWIGPSNLSGTLEGLGATEPMKSDGSFSISAPVPAFTDGVSYSVVTRKAHGIQDPSQVTTTPIAYQPLPAAATTTSLSASPAGTATQGASVGLTATVSPAAAGTVEFFAGAASLGSSAVSAGAATLPVGTLAVGTHQLTATFTPSDPAAYIGSTSTAVAYVITAVPAPDADATKTTVTVAPAPRVVTGTEVTLTGTVTNTEGTDVPSGAVEFFSTAAGSSTRVSVGQAPLVAGVATLATTTLAAGGHGFTAVYTPNTSDFDPSESAKSANYGVVDTSTAAACVPASGAETSAIPATASWSMSGYSLNSMPAPWAKTADGTNITVSGGSFEFANGEVVADAACATVAFDGWFKIEPHTGVWVTFTDPLLSVDAAGNGVWTADITTSDSPTAQRIVFASFAGAAGFGPGESVDASIAFQYTNAVAQGTWNADYANAWPNAFILKVPSSIQAYFYQTSMSALNLQKGPNPLGIEFEWPAATKTTVAVAPATRAPLGTDVTITANVAPLGAAGSVEFFQTSVADGSTTSLGTVPVTNGVAAVTTSTLSAGGHSFTAEFTSTNGFDASEGSYATANRDGSTSIAYYGIVDPAAEVVPAPTDGEHVSNVTAAWDWSTYSADWTKVAGGNVTVEDETFVLANGAGIVTDDAAVIDFTGTLRVEAYAAILGGNGAWVELVDPTLTIAGGAGTWTAGVRSGSGVYSAGATQELVIATVSDIEVPDFSQESVDETIGFDYAGTTAPGTWSTSAAGIGYTDAWANGFILATPSAIQAFYYASGAGGDVRKAPAALELGWTEPIPTATVVNGGASVVQGGTLQVSGSGFRDGALVTAIVHSDPVTIGTVAADASGVVGFSWSVPATFETGAHTVELWVGGVLVASTPLTVTAAAVLPVVETPEAPSCVAHAVSGASIQWGVKESYRSYITGSIANGTISGGWGAGAGAYSTETDRGRVSYTGAIHYTGHSGALDMTLSNPRIQVNSATSASLILNVQSQGYGSSSDVNASGVVFATLSLPAAAESSSRISWSNASATLTAAGAEAFAGFYSAGTALDPVSFSFPLGAEVPCDSTTTGDLAATGGETSFDVMWLGAGLLALGAILMVARRRRATV